jgi:hypothetical protein
MGFYIKGDIVQEQALNLLINTVYLITDLVFLRTDQVR